MGSREAAVAGLSFTDEYGEMLRLLRKARKAARLTQVEVARLLGKTQGFVSKLERGEIRIDPIELSHLADLYGVEVSDLLPKVKRSSWTKEPEGEGGQS